MGQVTPFPSEWFQAFLTPLGVTLPSGPTAPELEGKQPSHQASPGPACVPNLPVASFHLDPSLCLLGCFYLSKLL